MKFHEQKLVGVFIIEPEPYLDKRGSFHRHFCVDTFKKEGINFQINQTNFTANTNKHTLRGMHFRKDEFAEDKLFTCVKGAFFNAVIDLRKESPSYKECITTELNESNRLALYLPHGCANGFLTLEKNTVGHYYHSSLYVPGADIGVRYNDPAFNINWPAEPAVISDTDLKYPDFQE